MEVLVASSSLSAMALSAEFLDSAGSRCRRTWIEVWRNPFERAAAVRSFPSFKVLAVAAPVARPAGLALATGALIGGPRDPGLAVHVENDRQPAVGQFEEDAA